MQKFIILKLIMKKCFIAKKENENSFSYFLLLVSKQFNLAFMFIKQILWYAHKNDINKKWEPSGKSWFSSRLVCKPSSVADGHLSRHTVANVFKRCIAEEVGQTFCSSLSCTRWGLHGINCFQLIGGPLHHLSTLTTKQFCEKIGGKIWNFQNLKTQNCFN